MPAPAISPASAGSDVFGLGVDLVENERMRAVLDRWGAQFKGRVFLPAEQRYCEACGRPWQHYAGRFAVKEAVSKALGTGIGRPVGWLDIEVVRGASGAPAVRLRGGARKLARRRGVGRVLVSLAHTRNYAVAQALLISSRKTEKM
ncbi:MAG: holo-ACP synthase [Kiritimatiellaeota bacterium]|nr:holo-ACP synthase [Kiritimatiellota bacterium]